GWRAARAWGRGCAQPRAHRPDRDLGPLRHHQLVHDAAFAALDLEDPLLGLDLHDDVALGDGIARCNVPRHDGAELHVGAERWHAELARGRRAGNRGGGGDVRHAGLAALAPPTRARAAWTMPATCGMAACSR